MRRKKAREILADSLRELAAQMSVDRITVKAIAENCGYSQATFYRQFRDKYDLIAWDYSRRVGEIMDNAGTPDRPWRDTLLAGAVYFRDHRDYLANLFCTPAGGIPLCATWWRPTTPTCGSASCGPWTAKRRT